MWYTRSSRVEKRADTEEDEGETGNHVQTRSRCVRVGVETPIVNDTRDLNVHRGVGHVHPRTIKLFLLTDG